MRRQGPFRRGGDPLHVPALVVRQICARLPRSRGAVGDLNAPLRRRLRSTARLGARATWTARLARAEMSRRALTTWLRNGPVVGQSA